MKIDITDFNEIDFTEIDPEEDEFHLPDGSVYRFTENWCHVCWDGGTVLKKDNSEEYLCLRCNNILQWREVTYRLSDEEEEEKEKFLLPGKWDNEELEIWKEKFIERRREEINVRNNILLTNEGGEFL